MKKQMFSVVLGVFLFTSGLQAQHHEHGKTAAESSHTAHSGVPLQFQEQLKAVYTQSLQLKDAFVASDAGQVKAMAQPVEKAVVAVDMKLLQGEAHTNWMKYYNTLKGSLEAIQKATAIQDQRKAFADFNEALYSSIKAFGLSGQEVYFQYCPMALNNQGAYWLSSSKEILNPYFGDKMLKCGMVKETL